LGESHNKTPLLEKEGLGEIKSPSIPLFLRGKHYPPDFSKEWVIL